MSSYINSPLHFNSVEAKLRGLVNKSDTGFRLPYTFTRNKYPRLHQATILGTRDFDVVREELGKIFDTLRSLQALCVSLQYKHHYEGVLDAEIKEQTDYLLERKGNGKNITPHGLFKALACISYQIEVEHLKELRSLTKEEENALEFLELVQNQVAAYIVEQTDEYEEADWSL